MTPCPESKLLPFVSIVIPARNEADNLPRVFDAIGRLDYPADCREVILVDNGSSDGTALVARRHGAQVISVPDANVGGVRNAGAHHARGTVLAFVDADCLVPEGWLRAGVRLLADGRVGGVGGDCRVPDEGNWVERAWVVVNEAGSCDADALATSSFIMWRRVFEDLGGFDPLLAAGEDDDLSQRVRAAGYRLCHAPECAVVHLGYPKTLRGVFRRQLWHGRSQLHLGGVDPMLLLTHAFALSTLLYIPLALVAGNLGMAVAGGGLSLVFAALPAFIKERRAGPFSLLRFAQRVVVYCSFFLGRSFGLLLNYADLVGRLRTPRPMGEGGR